MRGPFIVCGLPRSRTAWLARFLTYGGVTCLHEASKDLRSHDDLKRLLDRYDTGIADTAIALLWQWIDDIRPDTRWIVVRRPRVEVEASLEEAGLAFDNAPSILDAIERALARVEQLPLARSVAFHELDQEEIARLVFEHCLSQPFDHGHWLALRDLNIQRDPLDMLIEASANREGIQRLYAGALRH